MMLLAPDSYATWSFAPLAQPDLGTVTPDISLGGTATLGFDSSIVTSGGVSVIGGAPTAGLVPVVLTATTQDGLDTSFDVTSSITLAGSAGGSITFDNIVHNQPATQFMQKNFTLVNVLIGGRANLSANQTAGTYTGTLTLTVFLTSNPLVFDTLLVTVTMVVIQPISISKILDLSFGAIFPSGTAGTVSIDRSAIRSVTGGVSLDNTDNGTYGQVTVTGEPNQAFTFAVPSDNSIVLSNGLGDSVTIQSWDIPSVTALDGSGVRGKRIGGTLSIGANQADGTYTGTFNVTATYD